MRRRDFIRAPALLLPSVMRGQIASPIVVGREKPPIAGLVQWHEWGTPVVGGSGLYSYITDKVARYSGPRNNVMQCTSFASPLWGLTSNPTLTALPAVVDALGGNRTYAVSIPATSGAMVFESLLSVIAGTQYTFSVYLKSNSGNTETVDVDFFDGATTLATCTVTTSWQRFSVTHTAATTRSGYCAIRSHLAGAADIQACCPMCNVGASALVYEDTPYPDVLLFGSPTSAGRYMPFENMVQYGIAGRSPVATLAGPWTIVVRAIFDGTKLSSFSFGSQINGTGPPTSVAKYVGAQIGANALVINTVDTSTTVSTSQVQVPQRSFSTIVLSCDNSGVLTLTRVESGESCTITRAVSVVNPVFVVGTALYTSSSVRATDSIRVCGTLIYDHALSASEIAGAHRYLLSLSSSLGLGREIKSDVVIIEGDSIAAGAHAVPAALSWPVLYTWAHGMMASYPGTDWISGAVGGSQAISGPALSVLDRVPSRKKFIRPQSTNNVYLYLAGSNDITASVANATIEAAIQSACTQMRAAGCNKVIVGTILPRDTLGAVNPAFENARQTINTWIRANFATFADAVADIAADATIGDAGDEDDTTYYFDGTHPNAVGQAIMAPIWKAAVDSAVTLT